MMKLALKIAVGISLYANNLLAQSITQDQYTGYNIDGFVNEQKAVFSNGDTEYNRSVYIDDLYFTNSCSVSSNNYNLLGYLYLKQKHVLNIPLETYTVLLTPSSNYQRVTNGTLTFFETNNPYPSAKYALETTVPITNFTPLHYNSSSCDLSISPYYKLQESYDAYDVYGNLIQKTLKGGKHVSFIFGYKGAYMTALADNAASNEIAYTSFENMADLGNWNYNTSSLSQAFFNISPFTGSYIYPLSAGDINAANLNQRVYVVSYWHNQGTVSIAGSSLLQTGTTINGWTYEERLVSGSGSGVTNVTVTGTGYIDELRLYPQGAAMQTYTYKPSVGVASKCDAKNSLTFYEYDAMNRVTLIRDQNGKIIKKMQYGLQTTE